MIPTNTAQSPLILPGFNMSSRINELDAKNQYAAYSTGAARAERRGDYTEAEKLWRKAAGSPCRSVRRAWALCRAEFCVSAMQKGWKPGHECEKL